MSLVENKINGNPIINLVVPFTRSEAESSRLDDDDNVDLEKSNVLLMGPTGSGMITMFQSLYFTCSLVHNVLVLPS